MGLSVWHYLGMAVAGAGVGFLSGMLGVGGAVLAVPVLVLVFGFAQHMAQGTSLAIVMFTAMAGAAQYWRGKNVHLPSALAFVIGSLVAVTYAARLAQRVPGDMLRVAFAVFMALVAASMVPKAELRSGGMLVGAIVIVTGLRILLR